ncbi:NTPase [Actinoplanes utahensis]|nr:NTPase [Actinoplanes utahensis]
MERVEPASMLMVAAKAILVQAGKELTKTSLKGAAARIGSAAERKALAAALGRAFAEVERKTDHRFSDFDINAGFWEHEGAAELAKVLIPGVDASAVTLAGAAVDSLGKWRSADARFDRVTALRPVFAVLLESLADEIRSEQALREFLGRSDAADTAIAATRLARHLGAGAAGADDRSHYLSWIIDQSRYLRTAGMVRNKTVPLRLAEVFVGLQAERDRNPGDRARDWFEQERARLAARLDAGELDSTRFEAALDQLQIRYGRKFAADRDGSADQVLPVLDVIRDTAHVLVLGDPGSGKTTLLHYLALTNARALREGEPGRFPIYFRISEYAQHGYPGTGISDFLPAYLRRMECQAVNGADLLRGELEAGRCVVLLDGLDEVASADLRRGVVGAVVRFVNAYARYGNRFVVTSRIAGYQAAPLPEPFQAVRLRDMDDEAITRFLDVYCREVERAETSEKGEAAINRAAADEAAAIGEALQTNPGVRRLAANPLLLTALVLVHRASGRLPHRRIEAYVEVCSALGHTWRNAQGVAKADLPDERILQEWLSALGQWLHANHPEGAAGKVELLSVLGPLWARHEGRPWDPEVLRSADPMSSDAGIAVTEFVEKADYHTGLLVERAPGRYGFAHLTFEEFYTGQAIARFGSEADRLATIRRHLHDPRYEEPILLALGLIGSTQYGQIENVVTQAIWPATGNPSPYEEILGRDFLFMLRVLADNPPLAAGIINDVVEAAIDEFLAPETSRCRFSAYREALIQRITGLAGTEAGRRLLAALDARAPGISGAEVLPFSDLVKISEPIGEPGPHTVSALLEIVDSNDPTLRMAAVEALPLSLSSCEAVTVAVLRTLDYVSDENVWHRAVRFAVHNDLFTEATKLAVVRTVLAPEHHDALFSAMYDLASEDTATEPVISLLVAEATGNPESEARLRAMDALHAFRGASESAEAAIRRLATECKDPKVRGRALASLTVNSGHTDLLVAELTRFQESGPVAGADPAELFTYMDEADESVKSIALSLVVIGEDVDMRIRLVETITYRWPFSEQDYAALAGLVASDDDPLLRARVAGALQYNIAPISEPAAVVLSRVVNGDDDVQVRVAAFEALARRRGGLTGAALAAALQFVSSDEDAAMRTSVVASFAAGVAIPDRTADTLARLTTGTDHPRVRAAAVQALGVGGRLSAAVVSAAIELAEQSDDAEVREAVLAGLVTLPEPPAAVIAIVKRLITESANWILRCAAARCLGRAVPAADVLDSLIGLFRDPDNDVRRTVGEALVEIARREPYLAARIRDRLAATCADPAFGLRDQYEKRPGWDYAYDALKLQVEVTAEDGPGW